MSTLVRDEQTTAWDLRGFWISGRTAVLTLSERCSIRRLEGTVSYVAVTGAYVLIAADGGAPWHIPCQDILGVAKPHHSQRASAKHR